MFRLLLIAIFVSPLLAMQPKLLYVSNEKFPNTLYLNQTFSLDLIALIATNDFDEIVTSVGEMNGVSLLNSSFTWRKIDEDRHKLSIYFQVTNKQINMPTINFKLIRAGEVIDSTTFSIGSKRASSVVINPQFSQVLADKLEIITHKVERFNDEQNILIMQMEADNSNLKDFKLQDQEIISQGIDWSQTRLPTTQMLYYATIPPTKEHISFNYFMPSSGDFKRVDLALDLSAIGQKISTHSDINPNKKDIPWINIFLLSITALSLILIFTRTHKLFLLFVVAINAAIIFWVVVREEIVFIRSNAEIRLLPTSTSTLFYKTDAPIEAKILKTTDEYYKVLLPDEKIGWVKKIETID